MTWKDRLMAPRGDARTLADLALAELREEIVSGAIPPGSPIRLNAYIDSLQMSAVPIREALRFLEQRGLIDRSPHRGVFVADMSSHDLEDTYRIRIELESLAVRQAARLHTPEDVKIAREILGEYAAETLKGPSARARDLHEQLHMKLYEMANSKWLALIIPVLWDNSERYRRVALPVRGTPEERIAEHAALVDAVLDGDEDLAEAALRHHLGHSFTAALEAMRQREDQRLLYSD